MNKFLMAAACAALLPLSGIANAAETDKGWYASIAAGYSVPVDMDTTNVINPASDEEMSFSDGWAVIGALGYRHNSYLRTEVEVGWRSYDADQINDNTVAPGFGPFQMDGDARVLNLGANAYYDFNLNSAITPYIGIGAGASQFSVNVHRVGLPASNKWDADDWSAYYQGMVGASLPIHGTSHLFVEYRYLGTLGMEAASNFGAFSPDVNDEEFGSHNFMIGARFGF